MFDTGTGKGIANKKLLRLFTLGCYARSALSWQIVCGLREFHLGKDRKLEILNRPIKDAGAFNMLPAGLFY
jgi:hypothetical protein